MSALPPDLFGTPPAPGSEEAPPEAPPPVSPSAAAVASDPTVAAGTRARPRGGIQIDRSRLPATILVGAIIAGVTLGGIGLDKVVAAGSIGWVQVGNVQLEAQPGWSSVTDESAEPDPNVVTLQKGDAKLAIIFAGGGYGGDTASLLTQVEQALEQNTADITFGETYDATVGANDVPVSAVGFTAINDTQTIDGELVAGVVDGDAFIFEAYAPQGDLDAVQGDIEKMIGTVEATQ